MILCGSRKRQQPLAVLTSGVAREARAQNPRDRLLSRPLSYSASCMLVQVNRTDLHQLAEERLADAEILLNNGRFGAAYYVAGYAVECALKACIAKLTKAEDFPDKKIASNVFTHDLTLLAKLSGVFQEIQKLGGRDRLFRRHWAVANNWSEASRYRTHSEAEARDLFTAVADPLHGVLQCLRRRW